MERLTRTKVKAVQSSAVRKPAKSKKCSEAEESSSAKDGSQPRPKIMRRDNSGTKGKLPKNVRNGRELVAVAPEPSTSRAQVSSNQIAKGLASSTHYNALVMGTMNANDAYYNIFEKVIARMSISNKTKLPLTWTIWYGNKEARAGSFAAMELLRMSSPTKPVQLFAQNPTLKTFKISVDINFSAATGLCIKDGKCCSSDASQKSTETVELEVTGKHNLEKVRKELYAKVDELRRVEYSYRTYFWYNNTRDLEETEKTLKEYGIRESAKLKLNVVGRKSKLKIYSKHRRDPSIYRCEAGGSNIHIGLSIRAVDVKSRQSRYKAIESSQFFRWFQDGMNFTGKCPRKECISNRNKAPGLIMDVVVCQKGFGIVELTPQNNKVKCPACKEGEFTPTNFLVHRGRALFRFKKSGPGKEVEQVLMEHRRSSKTDYVMFDETQGRSSKYDYFEIKTVNEWESPYYCVACGNEIAWKVDEYFPEGCGHAYHQVCRPSSQNCQVCEAPEWTEDEASSHNESLGSSANGLDSDEEEETSQ